MVWAMNEKQKHWLSLQISTKSFVRLIDGKKKFVELCSDMNDNDLQIIRLIIDWEFLLIFFVFWKKRQKNISKFFFFCLFSDRSASFNDDLGQSCRSRATFQCTRTKSTSKMYYSNGWKRTNNVHSKSDRRLS